MSEIIGNNGNDKEKKPLVMIIELGLDGKIKIVFPLLADKLVSYGFLKMAEKTLDGHYASQQRIVKPKGSMLDFARKKH